MENKQKARKPFNLRPVYFIAPLTAIIAIYILLAVLNEFYVNIAWFSEVGYLGVYLKQLYMGAAFSVPLFFAICFVFAICFKRAAVNMAENSAAKPFYLKWWWVRYLLGCIFAMFIMSIGSLGSVWKELLQFTNSVMFNETDPIFQKDISFYAYKLPLYEKLLNEAVFIACVMLFVSLLFVFFKSLRQTITINTKGIEMPAESLSTIWGAFKTPFAIFSAAFFILRACGLYLSQYKLLFNSEGAFFGAGYTDLHLWRGFYLAKMILCAILAVVCCISALRSKPKAFLAAIGVYIGVSLILSGIAYAYQSYVVEPNQFTKEEPYIANNIEYTQKAYGLYGIEAKQFNVENNLDKSAIDLNRTTIDNIPINDYLPTIDIYNSLQGIRPYYSFVDIDVDRYSLSGDYTQVFIAARELDSSKLGSNLWINTHLKYTHGFGFVASPVNQVTKTGQPVLLSKDIPPERNFPELAVNEPRIYFGELDSPYAIVNTKAKEFDYPEGNANMENVYSGNAGIPMTLFNRIIFAIRYATTKILFSSDITKDSKILINRSVRDRAEKIAPFLKYDTDPYLVLADGRLYFVLDAMTYMDKYPYSQPYNNEGYNYIRNSIKCVVDAYNGDTTFYLVDDKDPIAQTYGKIYPELLKPLEEMPASIRDHLRYSEEYFRVQSKMYSVYHMSNTSVFYNKEDLWEVATQFYNDTKDAKPVNPSYVIMKLPGRDKEEFNLIEPFTPVNKDNMVAWIAGGCDGENYGKLAVYEFPKQYLVYGPMQIEQRIDQDTNIAPQLNLLSQQGASLLRGNMQTIPINNSILYVEAIYVRSRGGEQSLPEAKKVICSYKDTIVMADTLESAITSIFGGPEPDKPQTPGSASVGAAGSAQEALRLYNEAQAALKAGNWAEYGRLMGELGDSLSELAKPIEATPQE